MSKKKLKRPTFAEAKQSYPHRFTMEHVPAWAKRRPIDDGGTEARYYAPQYRTDREWYDNAIFPEEVEHGVDGGYCHTTNQSWPLGQWLDQPFQKS